MVFNEILREINKWYNYLLVSAQIHKDGTKKVNFLFRFIIAVKTSSYSGRTIQVIGKPNDS